MSTEITLRNRQQSIFIQPGLCRWLLIFCLGFFSVNLQSQVNYTSSFEENGNLIPNGNFQIAGVNELPQGWKTIMVRPSLSPVFKRIEENGQSFLLIHGNGKKDVVGLIKTDVPVTLGKSYLLSVRFQITENINPQRNLLFQLFTDNNKDGIFKYIRKENGWVEGFAKINLVGKGPFDASLRIMFRFNETGEVRISNIFLKEVEPDTPRWVRVACTSGNPSFEVMRKLIGKAAEEHADILLLPEYMNTAENLETLEGPSCKMMSEMAAKHKMYIAGGIVRKDELEDRLYNTVVMYDRKGVFTGMYDKIHPYSPEVYPMGVTPGSGVTVLNTDFGRVGFMTCYDSWFTDVAELVSLKGAELILFPNAGYYRSLLPARATDNNVRIMASSLYNDNGIWDTQGRDVSEPNRDPTYSGQDGATFKDVQTIKVEGMKMLVASLDLNFSPSPHYNGGTMMSSPAGRRNRAEQLYYLDEDIRKEKERWWQEEEEIKNSTKDK
jgi:predicted amidohydrolase